MALASPARQHEIEKATGAAISKLSCMTGNSCTRDAAKAVVTCNWSVRNETRNINGTPRTMQLVNGEFPGPCIQAQLNDRIRVHVTNELPVEAGVVAQNISLHWHGLHLRGATFYDGTPLTQCPLKAGQKMTYDIPADVAGTHMWHSHYKLSLLDGMWGPLVVHDNSDPYLSQYDEERLISVTDFANETGKLSRYRSLHKPRTDRVTPQRCHNLPTGKNSSRRITTPAGLTTTRRTTPTPVGNCLFPQQYMGLTNLRRRLLYSWTG